MKNKTSIIKKIINSIYNIDEFPKYVIDGVKKALLYAFVLSILTGGIKGIIDFVKINSYMNDIVNTLNQDEYNFKIVDNRLNLENSPVTINQDRILFYIDDSIELDKANDLKKITENEDVNILILKDGLAFETNGDYDSIEDFEIHYSDMNIDEDITSIDIINTIESSKKMLSIFAIGSDVVQEFIMYIVSAFLIALLTIIPSKLLGVNYRLGDLFSLVVYAYTLPNLLVLALNIVFPHIVFDMAGMIGAMVYTYLAIRNIRKQIN